MQFLLHVIAALYTVFLLVVAEFQKFLLLKQTIFV